MTLDRRQFLRKALDVGLKSVGIGAAGSALLYLAERHIDIVGRDIVVEVMKEDMSGLEEVRIPVSSFLNTPPLNCARYARDTAYALSKGKLVYKPADAWNLRYGNETIIPEDNLEIARMALERKLPRGIIAGVFVPESAYNEQECVKSEPIKFTHNAVYVGLDRNKNAVFAHQFGNKVHVETLEEMTQKGLEIKMFALPKKQR